MAFPDAHAQALRHRAAACRQFVHALEHAEVRRVRLWSGNDTWLGPTATAFGEDLRAAVADLELAGEELRAAARRLDLAADRAEAAALAPAALTPR